MKNTDKIVAAQKTRHRGEEKKMPKSPSDKIRARRKFFSNRGRG